MRMKILHNEYQLNIRKWSLSLVLFSLFLTAIPMQAENNIPAEKISIEDAFTLIGIEYGIHFNYDRAVVADVEVDYESGQFEKMEDALQSVFSQTHLKYEVFDQRYVAVYRQDREGVESMKKMISHFQEVISSSEDAILRSERRITPPLATLSIKDIYSKRIVFSVSGTVTDQDGEPLIGVNIQVKGSDKGTATDFDGNFILEDIDENAVLVVSYIGYQTQEVAVSGRSELTVTLSSDAQLLDEVVVVGYGTQKKSDLTGSVSSIPKERLELVPNVDIGQAIQGSAPGVRIETTSAGAEPNQSIQIRGRNSITASNNPLIVLDGIPFSGGLADINPNNVESIEILKDASSAAIYGSRGANGVILVTSKEGREGVFSVNYSGYYSMQTFSNLPKIMDGKEFYEEYKMIRMPDLISVEEKEIYENESWVNWYDLILRTGHTQQHNLSVSGGGGKIKYYVSGGYLGTKGLTINDNYKRINNQINIDADIIEWITIGTRSSFIFNDKSGIGPSWSDAFRMNPLTQAYDEKGDILLYPWEGNTYFPNPLQGLLYDNIDQYYQMNLNNFAIIDFPFIEGLTYRLNTGFRFKFSTYEEYRGRNTKSGLDDKGFANTSKSNIGNTIIENIFNYSNQFEKHRLETTLVYSFENYKSTAQGLTAKNFPNDYTSWYGSNQAEFKDPSFSYDENSLISQMGRINYVYDDRYLFTATARRDGYSGFGSNTKWGIFPSFAIGWNFANEEFFPLQNHLAELKLRVSYGINGNQAVGSYRTLSRMTKSDNVAGKETLPGFIPGNLGQDELGWEKSATYNAGVDFTSRNYKVSGTINYFNTNTTDLLLDRSISPIHGFNTITENIGQTNNTGVELDLSINIFDFDKLNYNASFTGSIVRNKIVSLYGIKDENGNEVDDFSNEWFIGQPIMVYYDFNRIGTWQLDEVEEAEKWATKPGFVKIEDVNGDYKLDDRDKQILGQRDPKYLWGMNNNVKYGKLSLNIFIHGVHGFIRHNSLMAEDGTAEARQNTTYKDWWTPDNPTNSWVMNHVDAQVMGGATAGYYQTADFVRIKDITLSYELPKWFNKGVGNKIYFNLRNPFTITKWTGLDPELSGQKASPLQKEYVIGLNLNL